MKKATLEKYHRNDLIKTDDLLRHAEVLFFNLEDVECEFLVDAVEYFVNEHYFDVDELPGGLKMALKEREIA